MKSLGWIYTLHHPLTDEVRYIGQTRNGVDERLRGHINSSALPTSNEARTPVGKWIKKLLQQGLKPIIRVLREVELVDLDKAEVEAIFIGRTINLKLLNIARGGRIEGRKLGSKQSAAFCARQSVQRSGKGNQNFRDLTNTRFNKLVVVQLDGFREGSSWWLCQCDCGGTKIVRTQKLCRTLSCGCARKTRKITERQLAALKRGNRFRQANESRLL